MSRLDDKTKEALQSYVARVHPEETLHEMLFAIEEPNPWLRLLLLGTVISAAATRQYYVGLTSQRILLMPMTGPPDSTLEIMLSRVSSMRFDKRLLLGKFHLEYGENVKRVLRIGSGQSENARRFVEAYSLLPKPSLSEEELEDAQQAEAAYKRERQGEIGAAVAIALAIAVVLIIVAVAQRGSFRYPGEETSRFEESLLRVTVEQSRYASFEELYRSAPTNSTQQTAWEQWVYEFKGTHVEGKGRFDSVSIHPQEGKLYFIVTLLGEEGLSEHQTIQVALLVEDAQTVKLGKKEGSFLLNDLEWVYLGEDYAFRGIVSDFSRFDSELVRLGHSDLVIVRGRLQDLERVGETAIDSGEIGDTQDEEPPVPIAIYVPQAHETPVTPRWDYTQVSCDGKPFNMWGSPGTYLYKRVGGTFFTMTLKPGEAIPNLGVSGPATLSAAGTVTITTGLGTFRATLLSAEREYSILTGRLDSIRGTYRRSEWYVCGYGLIKLTSSDAGVKTPGDYAYSNSEDLVLVSFTPLTTNESHVRYILADIQLGNVADEYRVDVTDEETAEALRRWDVGIRVANTEELERKIVDGQWRIVYAGTDNPIMGMDIILTSDSP